MEKALKFLRGSVRPVLTYLFAAPFVGLVVYAFIRFGTPDLALSLIMAFVAIVGMIAGLYFQSRNQPKPPATKG